MKIYPYLRRALFTLSAETAHDWVLGGLEELVRRPRILSGFRRFTEPRMARSVSSFGLEFPNRIGTAAGVDKDAAHVRALTALGFGFIEIGSVTARPWSGEDRPRIGRIAKERALVNKVGLPSIGADAVAKRLRSLPQRRVPLFVNVAKTADARIVGDDAIEDYCYTVNRLRSYADVLVLNISCPNTADGKSFEAPEGLRTLLGSVMPLTRGVPVSVKVSPDLEEGVLRELVAIALAEGVAGFTATNTTSKRQGLSGRGLPVKLQREGGLSGPPLRDLAIRTVRIIADATQHSVPIVGVGGCSKATDVERFVEAGATLIEVYTGLVYEGPGIVRSLCTGGSASLGSGS
ncbi:MAG: quinone-dependent dihydroorotate dehydrogenase [Deltaproteobacteria bacterium]|nr:quinone-dependent dihydroorotate dehydrogenase [Deltaproteobacteria bacterium]